MSVSGGVALALFLLFPAVILLWLLIRQLRQRKMLLDWLAAPDLATIPDGSGGWREVFSRLQRLRKEEIRQQDALQDRLERFRLAAQALPDGVILLNAQAYIEWLNVAACRHFALDIARDVGTLVEQLIRQSEFRNFFAAYRAGVTQEALSLRTGANGAEQVLSIMLIPFAGSRTLLLSRDVTEVARTEAIRRDFVANVSHELRTPLTVITGFLEQFSSERPPAGDAAKTFLRLMTEQTDRMNRLVADLLTLSRLENDSQPPRDETIDVAALVGSLVAEAQALSAGKHAFDTTRVAATQLRGSADEIRSAFGNLVFNAVRYTPAGGQITLVWGAADGCPTFSVTDTGIGIPAEHIPRLTERFYRVDKGRSTAAGGTGLGLAIVKHVLARHGGGLQIQSVSGQGSTFSARLPAERLVRDS